MNSVHVALQFGYMKIGVTDIITYILLEEGNDKIGAKNFNLNGVAKKKFTFHIFFPFYLGSRALDL